MGPGPFAELRSSAVARAKAAIDWFVPPDVAASELGPRARTAVGIGLLMVAVFAGLTITHAIARSYREAYANLALTFLMLVGPLLVRWTSRYAASINATVGVAFLLIVLIGANERGAGINAATVALAEFPLFTTLLLGPRIGALWLLASVGASAAIGIAGVSGLVENRVPPEMQLFDDHVVLAVVTLTLYLVAALYERGRAQGLAHIASLDQERRRAELDKLQAQAETRLARAERLATLGSVAAATAHEINNPLSYVSNNIEFVRTDGEKSLSKEARQALGEALDGVRRIQTIVGDLKAFARPETDRPQAMLVSAAIATALKMAEGQIRARARVSTELEGDPVIVASETRIVQLLLNLLVNAAQAIPEGPPEDQRIVVRMRSNATHATVEVEDTGVGVPLDVIARLGEPFFTTKEEGLGLGLAVCHHIVQDAGGSLDFESRKGRTVARVSLPLAEERTDERAADEGDRIFAAGTIREKLRILVVDDEHLVARAMARHLREHDVHVCHNGKDALSRLDAGEHYDLVLCDLMMPDLSGMDVFGAIRERHPGLAPNVVFMTGGTFTERAHAFREQSRNAFLEKPIDLTRLSRIVGDRIARTRIEPEDGSEVRRTPQSPKTPPALRHER